jgi:alpha-beta hydrolase superfamily lysophospholipase
MPSVVHDLTLPSADGLALRARLRPNSAHKGWLIIAHGFGEHAGCYDHVTEALGEASGLSVVAFDFRGHGLSPGARGVVRAYGELVDDLQGVFDWCEELAPGLPRFVLGHSNGGQVALRFAERGPDLAGLVLSNPALRLMTEVPPWKLGFGRLMRVVAPAVTLDASYPHDWMTRDTAMREARARDGLRHTRMSPRLFFGMIEGGARLLADAGDVHAPVLLLLGDDDPLIDPAGARAMFGRLGSQDKTMHVYPGGRHEPFNDLDRAVVLKDVGDWLREHLAPVLAPY